jgi:hypothetical protein
MAYNNRTSRDASGTSIDVAFDDNLQRVALAIGGEGAQLPLPVGRTSAAGSAGFVLSNEDLAAINALGTILTAIGNKLPAALGQGTMAQSLSVTFASDQSPVDIDGAVALAADRVNIGGVDLLPKYAAISAASAGDNTAVAAVVGKKIRVLSYAMVADNAVTARFQSDTTDLTGAMSFAASGGISATFSPVGHFETAVGVALQLNLGSAVGVRGHLVYVEV